MSKLLPFSSCAANDDIEKGADGAARPGGLPLKPFVAGFMLLSPGGGPERPGGGLLIPGGGFDRLGGRALA